MGKRCRAWSTRVQALAITTAEPEDRSPRFRISALPNTHRVMHAAAG